jgi:hypothetical protein
VALFGIGGQASASTTVGEVFGGADLCFAANPLGGTWLQSTSPGGQYQVNDFGVITAWSYQAGSAPFIQMQLKVANPAEPPGNFVIVGESEIETPAANTLNTFKTQISIDSISESGPVLGFWVRSQDAPVGANCMRFPPADYRVTFATGNIPVNESAGTWIPVPNPTGIQLDVAAVLEPDADSDEFGDESQDTCLPPAVRVDCDPPETTITDGPRLKRGTSTAVKAPRRLVKLEFRSDERRSTFECRLDKNRFKPCEPPFRKRLKTGRTHRFDVRATDRGGNVDPSPAKHRFRIR